MKVLSLENVLKTYQNYTAVNRVSFDVEQGSIFGLLGPNGAGKTSLIRIITRITSADEGVVKINGEDLNSFHPNTIGYMPEERGLYKKMKVGEQLLYLAQLKGLDSKQAKSRVKHWLEKFEITHWWDKKISELSKGMSQKIQFIATVVHEPSLIILDEPFSGLDPINANLIKDEIYNLKNQGKSILFSTHRMEQVEEICDEIVLINKGSIILDGKVSTVKQNFKEGKFRLSYQGDVSQSFKEKFNAYHISENTLELKTSEGHIPNDILSNALNENIIIESYQEILPTLNEIFIKKVSESHE